MRSILALGIALGVLVIGIVVVVSGRSESVPPREEQGSVERPVSESGADVRALRSGVRELQRELLKERARARGLEDELRLLRDNAREEVAPSKASSTAEADEPMSESDFYRALGWAGTEEDRKVYAFADEYIPGGPAHVAALSPALLTVVIDAAPHYSSFVHLFEEHTRLKREARERGIDYPDRDDPETRNAWADSMSEFDSVAAKLLALDDDQLKTILGREKATKLLSQYPNE